MNQIHKTDRKISSFQDELGWHGLGHRDIHEIIPTAENGEMAEVPWLIVKYKNGVVRKVNCKYVQYIEYESNSDSSNITV